MPVLLLGRLHLPFLISFLWSYYTCNRNFSVVVVGCGSLGPPSLQTARRSPPSSQNLQQRSAPHAPPHLQRRPTALKLLPHRRRLLFRSRTCGCVLRRSLAQGPQWPSTLTRRSRSTGSGALSTACDARCLLRVRDTFFVSDCYIHEDSRFMKRGRVELLGGGMYAKEWGRYITLTNKKIFIFHPALQCPLIPRLAR